MFRIEKVKVWRVGFMFVGPTYVYQSDKCLSVGWGQRLIIGLQYSVFCTEQTLKMAEESRSGPHSQDKKERLSLLNRFEETRLGKEFFQYWWVLSLELVLHPFRQAI